MNTLKRLISFLFPTPSLRIKRVLAKNNWDGIPEPDLSWDEVRVGTEKICPIIPMTYEVTPDNCPVCGDSLERYWSDSWEIESGVYDYMVTGVYCKRGHYTHLDWA